MQRNERHGLIPKGEVVIDYIIRVISIPAYYFAIAVAILGVLWVITRRWTISLLIAYIFTVLAIVVFNRSIKPEIDVELTVFWSYKTVLGIGYDGISKTHLLLQIIGNIVLFIPIGVLSGILIGWKGVLVGSCFSLFIEVIQYVSHRGLFEIDDIIDNTLGTIIGIALFFAFMKLKKCN